MSNLVISRPPQFLDPWFVEIEQVWDEIEAANNDNDSRITTLEGLVIGGSGVVTSVSKFGSAQLTGDVTFTGTGSTVLNQVGQNIEIAGGGVTDHGALTGLADDDHTQYILVNGTRAFSGNQSFGMNQATNFRVENLGVIPAAGNQGRLIFDTVALNLKVDNGTSFVSAGVTDHGFLTGLGDDDHTQYLLTDGTRACTGDFTVNGKYKGEASEPLTLESQDVDGASAVGVVIDTFNNLTVAGAKLLSVRNAGVEKFYIDKDGNLSNSSLSSPTSLYALIDTDNDSFAEAFRIEHDDPNPGFGGLLFEVNEVGEAQVGSALRVGSLGVPSDTLDVDGTANISGDVLIGGLLKSNSNLTFQVDADDDESAEFRWDDGQAVTIAKLLESGEMQLSGNLKVGSLSSPTEVLDVEGNILINGIIKSNTGLSFQVDADNDDSSSFSWLNGLSQTIMSLDESGNLTTTGTITGGASPFKFISVESDGPSAVAYELDTFNPLVTSGAKLFSLKNNGVEKFSIDKDGNIAGVGFPYVTVDPSEGGAGIQSAINTVSAAGGGIVQLLIGTYTIPSTITWPLTSSNVVLQGSGKGTVLSSTVTAGANVLDIPSTTSGLATRVINNPTKGDTSITTTTAGQASAFTIDMPVLVRGNDPDGYIRLFMNEVLVAGDGGTGIIQLKYQVPFTLTSANVTGWSDGIGNELRDFSMVCASGSSLPISTTHQLHFTARNLYLDGKGFSFGSGMIFQGSIAKSLIENCEIKNFKVNAGDVGLDFPALACEVILNNVTFQNCGSTVTSGTVKANGQLENVRFTNCLWEGDGGNGFRTHTSGSAINNSTFENCTFIDCYGAGLNLNLCKSVAVVGSTFQRCGWGGGTDYGIHPGAQCDDLVVNGCTFDACKAGSVTLSSNTHNWSVVGNTMYNMDVGIVCITSNGGIISGNMIRACGDGIYIDGCTKISVTGNTCLNNTSKGIDILNLNSDILISGNTSLNSTTANLNINNSSSNILVVGNNFRGGTVTLGTGTNIVYEGNME